MANPIRITGMSSGLPPDLVDKIVDAEKIPVQQMEAKKVAEDEKLKLVTDLETKISEVPKSLSEMVGIHGFTKNKLTSGDPNIIGGEVDPDGAVTGEWGIEVMQLANKPGAMSNGFPDRNETEIGVGYLKFETPDGTKEVYIPGGSATLDGVASAINASGTGLRASVLNDRKDKEAPFKLMITGLATGDDKQVNFPVVYMLDGDQDFFFDKSRAAQNAKIKVDGFEIEAGENSIKDVIPGVTLQLKQAMVGKEVTVSVKEDIETISGKIKGFVDAFNGVLGFIQGQHKIQKDKSGRERLGPMGGDGMLRTIENSMRRLILNPQIISENGIKRLSEMGIEFNRNGTLNLDQQKFNSAVAKNPSAVAEFLQGDGFNTGFIPSVKREVANILNTSFGSIGVRKRGIQEKINNLNDRIDQKTRLVEKKEAQIREKFANLESTMSKLQSQGSAVGQMAAGLGKG